MISPILLVRSIALKRNRIWTTPFGFSTMHSSLAGVIMRQIQCITISFVVPVTSPPPAPQEFKNDDVIDIPIWEKTTEATIQYNVERITQETFHDSGKTYCARAITPIGVATGRGNRGYLPPPPFEVGDKSILLTPPTSWHAKKNQYVTHHELTSLYYNLSLKTKNFLAPPAQITHRIFEFGRARPLRMAKKCFVVMTCMYHYVLLLWQYL